ncbi:MAG: TldD/PmbA family protein [Rhodothermales bacterium]|nr:TldD/PmbA family protein [Rhodothermales bacterium]
MSFPSTDTSRLTAEQWHRLADSIPIALDVAVERGSEGANVFLESSRRDQYHFRQVVAAGRPQPSEQRRTRHYVEGASVTAYSHDCVAVACIEVMSKEGARAAALSACEEAKTEGRTSASPSDRLAGLDVSMMLEEQQAGLPAATTQEVGRSLAEVCLAVCPDAVEVGVVISEEFRRRLVVSTYGPPRISRHAFATTIVTCERERGPDVRVVAGFAGQENIGPGCDVDRMIHEICQQGSVRPTSYRGGALTIPIVFEAGWCAGVWLHEAVGHFLEGDNVLKGWSPFSKPGEKVAPHEVTIVDDPAIHSSRGSISFDDEGMPAVRNVLVASGVVEGHVHSRLTGRHSGVAATGNGRRENYRFPPAPRMTNLVLENGGGDRDAILASISKGLLINALGSGTVDVRTGRFSFDVILAHWIEGGRTGEAVTGLTLSGDAQSALASVRAVGDDFAADAGRGICRKGGQTVPVGLGSPTVHVDGLRVQARN